jgi:hypothetical protein
LKNLILSVYSFVKHLRNQHNITFDEKKHGYRETENIKALIEECLRRPSDCKVSPFSYSGVRIVETPTVEKQLEPHSQERPMELPPLLTDPYNDESGHSTHPMVPTNFLLTHQRPDGGSAYHLQSN